MRSKFRYLSALIGFNGHATKLRCIRESKGEISPDPCGTRMLWMLYNPCMMNPTKTCSGTCPTCSNNILICPRCYSGIRGESTWMTFCSGYHELAAAGGGARCQGHVLWIQRNGKWIYPRALEHGERLERPPSEVIEAGIEKLTTS